MITQNFIYIYQYLEEKSKFNIKKEIMNYLREVRALYSLLYETFYSKKIENLPKINSERYRLIDKELPKIMENLKGENSMIAHYLGEMIRFLGACGGALLTFLS